MYITENKSVRIGEEHTKFILIRPPYLRPIPLITKGIFHYNNFQLQFFRSFPCSPLEHKVFNSPPQTNFRVFTTLNNTTSLHSLMEEVTTKDIQKDFRTLYKRVYKSSSQLNCSHKLDKPDTKQKNFTLFLKAKESRIQNTSQLHNLWKNFQSSSLYRCLQDDWQLKAHHDHFGLFFTNFKRFLHFYLYC